MAQTNPSFRVRGGKGTHNPALETQVIKVSNCPCALLIVLVKKKDGSLQICVIIVSLNGIQERMLPPALH